jgi:arylformamidase
MRGMAASVAVGLSNRVTGQQSGATATRVKGPVVFLNYDQKELDDAYTQEVWAPNADQIRQRYIANSDVARSRLAPATRQSYGPTTIEGLDIYRTTRSDAPIQVFIHGGAWRASVAQNWAFVAEPFINAGAHVIIPDFSWVQDVGGSLMTMADQVRRAIAWVARNAKRFGGDADRIYVTGHSSGGHLAAVAMTTDWRTLGLPVNLIKGGVCCSGLFDLKGPRLSVRSSYIKFDDETEQSLSPIRHLDRLTCPVAIAYASLDSPEFQRQSQEFAAALRPQRKLEAVVRGEAYNHFELIETLANPYGLVGKLAIQQMKLKTPTATA